MQKILIVDDDRDLLEMVTIALSNFEMKVECLADGNRLIECITAFEPNLILLDIYLNDCDGRELCYKLKSSDQYKNIPVILYSAGHISAQSIRDSLADDFIPKPFSISQLVKRIKNFEKPRQG
jgi:DNA-binding response OmpR family regulator